MQQTEQQDKGVRTWTRILLFFGVSLLFFVMADRAMAARQVPVSYTHLANSSFGIAKEHSAVIATTITTMALTILASTAA